MRKFLFFILVGCSLCACKTGGTQAERNGEADSGSDSLRIARMTINSTRHDFGNLVKGEVVSHTFEIQNTGNKDLIIKNIETGCGCATPKYKKGPIKPGQTVNLEIKFNTAGRLGKQYKVIHIFANTPERTHEVTITANIKQNIKQK